MSRGGRGGFGRGRGGGGGGGPTGPTFGGDDLTPDYSVTELFPPCPPPIQSTLSKTERHTVSRFRSHRKKIHHGPLYTVISTRRAHTDVFSDIAKYSARYTRTVRATPKLDARPYVHEFFPEELGGVMGRGDTAKKELVVRRIDAVGVLEEMELEEGGEEEGDKKGAEEGKEEGEGVEGSDVEVDDFDDDDEGDYNAEQYFEDGDEGEDYGDDDGGAADFF